MYRSRSIYNNKGPTLLVSYSDQYVRPSVCLSFHLSVRLFEHISSYPNLVYTSSTECLWVKVCSDLEPTFWSKFKFITDLCVNIVVLLAQSTSYVTLREPFYKRLCFDLELYWRSQRSRLCRTLCKILVQNIYYLPLILPVSCSYFTWISVVLYVKGVKSTKCCTGRWLYIGPFKFLFFIPILLRLCNKPVCIKCVYPDPQQWKSHCHSWSLCKILN